MSVVLKPTTAKIRNEGEEFQGFNVMADEKTSEKIAAIEAKGAEVLESLPGDYTEVWDILNDVIDMNLYNPSIVFRKYVSSKTGVILDSASYVYAEISNISSYNKLKIHTNMSGSCGICFYTEEDSFISGVSNSNTVSPYVFDDEVVVPKNADIVRISCLTNQRNDIKCIVPIKTAINGLTSLISDNTTLINKIQNMEPVEFINGCWFIGGINGNTGAFVDTNSYIRTNYIDVSNYETITIIPQDGFRYAFAFYDNNINAIDFSGAATNPENRLPRTVEIQQNAVYFAIAIGDINGSQAVLDYANNVAVTAKNPLLVNIEKLNTAMDLKNGNLVYSGKRISLIEDETKVYKCDISLWKDFYGGGTLSNYSLHLNQSMAIYSDYVFLFQDGGTVTVINYSTKEIIGKYNTPIMETNHHNGAQFSKYYYDDSDEFPLLLVSRASTYPHNECLIYRVQRNDLSFTFTLVNTLNTSPMVYQATWGVDNKRNTLSCIAYTTSNYGVETNNSIIIRSWIMPTKEEILSGDPISLSLSDALIDIPLPYAAFQQCIMHNGNIYVCYQPRSGGRNIYCFDGFNGNKISDIALPDTTSEMEGLYVYNGKMYVSQKRGTDTEAVNPLTIYEITF